MLINNTSYSNIKTINSNHIDLRYAAEVVESKTLDAEKEGWKRFGVCTPIYNKDTNEFMFVQLMTK